MLNLICCSFSESFAKHKLDHDVVFSSGICQNCFIKFHEFDEHQTAANKIAIELLQLYEKTAPVRDIKLEIKREIDDDEYGIVEVMLDGADVGELSDDSDDIFKSAKSPKSSKKPKPLREKLRAALENNEKRAYKRKKNLDEGLIVVEVDGEKIYQCDVCQKLCRDRYKLKTHREIHTTERTVCCNECGAMFKTLTCLYSHKKIHRDRVYHQCDHCEMRYIQKTQLRKHMDAIHLKRKDHVCSICGKNLLTSICLF